jgi:hypothetical protein
MINDIKLLILIYITNLVCYTYFHWFVNPECQHIFGKQTGYIFKSPKTIKTWTTKHYNKNQNQNKKKMCFYFYFYFSNFKRLWTHNHRLVKYMYMYIPQKRLKHGRQNITLHWINGIIRNNKCIFTKLNAVLYSKRLH